MSVYRKEVLVERARNAAARSTSAACLAEERLRQGRQLDEPGARVLAFLLGRIAHLDARHEARKAELYLRAIRDAEHACIEWQT